MRHISGEMDPSKDLHRSVFKLALAQFSIFVNEMIRDFHNIFDPQADKNQFERTLRYYISGKENYDLRQRLNIALKAARGVAESPSRLSFRLGTDLWIISGDASILHYR